MMDPFDFLFFAVIAAVLVGLGLCVRQRRGGDPFILWLSENLPGVKDGTALYGGTPVTLETELAQFQGVASIVAWSCKFSSRLLVVGRDNLAAAGAGYTVQVFLGGWWGIPHGIFWTLQALWVNLRGGRRMKVRDLLAPAQPA